jgi:hypothetical protein
MKTRVIKLAPSALLQLLQGKNSVVFSLPSDTEILDLKLDLLNNQVVAVIRSESFDDVAETTSTPEYTSKGAEPKNAVKPVATAKVEVKQELKIPAPPKSVEPVKTTLKMENEFSPDQRKLLSFTLKGDVVVVKPIQFLKEEWEDINEVVRSLGGKWVRGDIISYWEIPFEQ